MVMKNSVLIFACLLLYSCHKKQEVFTSKSTFEKKNIKACYQKSIQKDQSSADEICSNVVQLEKWASTEPKEYQAMVAIIAGLQNSNKSLYQLGTKNYEKALFLLKNSNADSLKAKALNGIGSNYKTTGNYPKAVKNLYAALALYDKDKNTVGACSVHTLLSDVYFQMDQFDKAESSVLKAMEVLEHQKSSIEYLSAMHSLANLYGMKGNFAKALELDEIGIAICDSINAPKIKVSFLDNKANCFLYSNQMDSAYFYFNECLKLDLRIGNKKQIADTYSNLGQFFRMKKNYPEAERQIKKSIEILKSVDAKPNIGKAYTILAEIYTNQNQFQKAFETQRLQMLNTKAMIEEREANALAEYKIVYETQKKEAEIAALQLENKVRKLTIDQQLFKMKRKNHGLLLLGFGILLLLAVVYFRNQQQKLRRQLEHEQTVKETEESERIRLAKDIHDDLGSGLSKINFLSELISQQTKEFPDIKHSTESIKETSKKLIDNMRDLIWALNPENATLANLVARMREHTTDYLEDFALEITYHIPEKLPSIIVGNEVHRALFLVVKEVIHNITKHAKATHINFTIEITDTGILICIQDNGIGFNHLNSNGNGLKNMQSRIEKIRGKIAINSLINEGTEVCFEIDIASNLKILL